MKVKVLVTQSCLTLCDRMDHKAHQAPLPMEFSRQEYWSGYPFPSPGDLLDTGFTLGCLHCRQVLYHLSHQEALWRANGSLNTQLTGKKKKKKLIA